MSTKSWSLSPPPLIASGLFLLSILSGSALADDAATPEPHWSGLPIWGAEAQARGYQIPLPLGIGITGYSARQPVDIHDLQLGRRDNPPRSVTNFLQINRVDTSQQNVSAKIDVLVFPFLDVYALLGYTKGTTKGLIQVPGDPILGIFEPAVLQLNASFRGPTYGGGVTAQGGFKVSDWRDLTAIVVADVNRTKTELKFDNETLIAKTKPMATVFSARVGVHGTLGPRPVGRSGRAPCTRRSSKRLRAVSPTRTFSSSWSSRRRNRGTRCSVAPSRLARSSSSLLEEGLAPESRSSRAPCTDSDRSPALPGRVTRRSRRPSEFGQPILHLFACGLPAAKSERQRHRDRDRTECQKERQFHDFVGDAHRAQAHRDDQAQYGNPCDPGEALRMRDVGAANGAVRDVGQP
jgi:hypothetical protein